MSLGDEMLTLHTHIPATFSAMALDCGVPSLSSLVFRRVWQGEAAASHARERERERGKEGGRRE